MPPNKLVVAKCERRGNCPENSQEAHTVTFSGPLLCSVPEWPPYQPFEGRGACKLPSWSLLCFTSSALTVETVAFNFQIQECWMWNIIYYVTGHCRSPREVLRVPKIFHVKYSDPADVAALKFSTSKYWNPSFVLMHLNNFINGCRGRRAKVRQHWLLSVNRRFSCLPQAAPSRFLPLQGPGLWKKKFFFIIIKLCSGTCQGQAP